MSAARVGFVIFPDFQILDLTGPLEILSRASIVARESRRGAGYASTFLAGRTGLVRSSSGLDVVATRAFSSERGPLDTLVVVGGVGVAAAARDRATIRFVRRMASLSRRVASICTGAFILAAAGLLDRRRASTHWAYAELLAESVPSAEIDTDAIYTRDGSVYTSAGVTAGMDLTLALVEADLGRDAALSVARHLVMYVQRAGGQSQFSPQLRAQIASREPLKDVQSFILDNVSGDLSVGRLAKYAGMSVRNFGRQFRREVGVTPAQFVEHARIDVARRLLEQTSESIDAIAERSGFGRVETLRRAFRRRLAVSLGDYRKRFRA